ncbi:hypothetical protein FQN54_009590 [Arachnomyces sp. PD_36]|nr:hypothetical protein FQN54_009590 [Arachnomyces sp. PD_36]
MAILGEFEVTVIVNGNAVTEYNVDEDDQDSAQQPNTVTKYIEAVSDAEFSLNVSILPHYELRGDIVGWHLYVDGVHAESITVAKEDFEKGRCVQPIRFCLKGTKHERYGKWMLQHFKFSSISFGQSGDQEEHVSVDRASQAGNLEVKAWCYRLNSYRAKDPNPPFNPLRNVSEKSLKGQALSHTVGLGSCENTEKYYCYVDVERLGDAPLATFVFKYRSRKALQDLTIIPRSPTPVPVEQRPVDDLSMEEMRELIQQLRAEAAVKRGAQPATKQEIQSGIKRERSESRDLTSVNSSGETSRTPATEPDSDIECTGSRPVKCARIEEISLFEDD